MKADTKSTPNFGEASKRFRDAGMDARWLLPIAPVDAMISANGLLEEKSLGKAPGRYNPKTRDWTGLGGTVTRDGLSSGDIKAAASWPTPNVGICGAYLPGIDSDAMSPEARRLVDRALIRAFGDDAQYAVRRRGDNDRALYAFQGPPADQPENAVKTRFIKYRLAGDDPSAKPHGLDIIGFGNQYVAAGIHPDGDLYDWEADWHVATLLERGTLEPLDNKGVGAFLEVFTEELKAAGGEILHASKAGGGDVAEQDYSDLDPVMPVDAILEGLDRMPNSDRNRFPFRDDFVQAVAAIRAALGSEAEAHEDDIREWACQDEDWCSPEYFDKVWNSLSRGQRVGRHSLDAMFRRNKIYVSAKYEFPDDVEAAREQIRVVKSARKSDKERLLDEVAEQYFFGHVNTLEDNSEVQMRLASNVGRQWAALKWWQFKSQDAKGKPLVLRLHEKYPSNEAGFWDFIRDLGTVHPDIWFSGETRHPGAERGKIVVEENLDGSVTQYINMRYLSPVIRYAKKEPENKWQAREDVKHLLDFMGRLFPEKRLIDYELDTLAYMVKTGERPGHLLFMVGFPGVGKSIYTHMLISMFDGIGKGMGGQIDGTKLVNENSRRFALARVEGCRIISVKELPDGKASTPANMAAVTATLKQIVDPGPDADYFQIEKKGVDSLTVRNFARVVLTSNYENSIHIEEHDRRIFYNQCGITLENKPAPEYYTRLTTITKNPERLAAFWRYLRDRDTSHYNVALPPPVTVEKKAAQITGVTNPVERHMAAAFMAFQRAGRSIFTIGEVAEVMTAMSYNEYVNTHGVVDDRRNYDLRAPKGPEQAALKQLARDAIAQKEIRSDSVRHSRIYVLKKAEALIARLASARSAELIEALERDRKQHPLSSEHDIEAFSGSPRPKGDN
ncbi:MULTISPECIES: DUF5906 domain-containing protein [Methylobacterium]|uniref:DUF5906 domain-containing protein n=1 Tax=Methylobacterium TaxID=407 RepID=UPI0013EB9AB3|nr:DUF5906 domain-containing protein [Methylobacterium sp. DB0501]NGM36223.1 hypothetical protein [Methylobacterium sp. DB0501]